MDDERAQPLDARMAHLEGAFVQVDKRLDSIERRFDSIDRRVGQRSPEIDVRVAQEDPWLKRFDTRCNWLMGTMVASWVTTIATQIGTTLIILHHR